MGHGKKGLLDAGITTESKKDIQAVTNLVWDNATILEKVKSRKGELPQGVTIGLPALDRHCRFDKGRLVTIAGDTASGKTSLVYYIISQLYKMYGWKSFVYAAEETPEDLVVKLSRVIEGTDAHEYDFMDGFYLMKRGNRNYQDILSAVRGVIQEGKQVDVVVVDCYNRLDFSESSRTETENIGNMLRSLSDLAIETNTLVFVVTHMKKDTYTSPSMNKISGSANWGNMSDYVLIVEKNRGNTASIHIAKVKSSNYGDVGTVKLRFYAETGTYDDGETPDGGQHPIVHVTHIPDREGWPGRRVLDVKVSQYENANGKSCTTVNLWERLTKVSEDERVSIDLLRQEEDEEQQKKLKEKLPMITVSARYDGRRINKNIVEKTGLICLDFDEEDNPASINELPTLLRSLQYVAYFAQSSRGQGYYAIVPIDDPDKHFEYWESLRMAFEKKGYMVDPSTSDIGRTRFVSYDDNFYENPSVSVYKGSHFGQEVADVTTAPTFMSEPVITDASSFYDYELTRKPVHDQLLYILNAATTIIDKGHMDALPDYDSWFKMGLALAYNLGEEGRYFFHALSRWYPRYKRKECDSQYNKCLRAKREGKLCGIGTVMTILSKAGIRVYPENSNQNTGLTQAQG